MGDEEDFVDDTSEKFVGISITMDALRRDDETWQQPQGLQKTRIHGLISSRIFFFHDKPYVDFCKDDISAFTVSFLLQPQGYGWSLDFDPNFFCELAYEGFISTSMEIQAGDGFRIQVLLPWIDPKRNSLDFGDVHISRQVRKRAKHYAMTVDAAFERVMLGCIHQHGEGWLYRGLRCSLRALFKNGYTGCRGIHVGVHSFELWDDSGELVAGDLGYTVGGVYTSMTGFRLQHSRGAGEVQLILTAALLHKMCYSWWDLGMVMRYKARLGAKIITREDFIARLHSDRDKQIVCCHDRICGADLLGYFLAVQRDADPASLLEMSTA